MHQVFSFSSSKHSLRFIHHSISSRRSNWWQIIRCVCLSLTFSCAWFLLKDFVRLPYRTDNVDGEGTSYITFFFNLRILYETHSRSVEWLLRFPLQNGVESEEAGRKHSLCFKLKHTQRYRPRAQYRCNENYVTVKHLSEAVRWRNMDVKRQWSYSGLLRKTVNVESHGWQSISFF